MKHFIVEFKQKVIDDYNTGTYDGRDSLAKYYGISRSRIWHWIEKDRKQGNQINDIENKRGRPKEKDLTKEDYKERYEILKNIRSSSRYNERE